MTNDINATYPLAILWTWENHHKALRLVRDVDRQLADKDAEIARKQAELEQLKGQHRTLGKDHTDHKGNAFTFLEMVETWCKTHGDLPLPPKPVEPEPAPAGLRPDPDQMQNAGIWDATECECGARILRNKLNSGPWGHPDNGSSRCRPEDEDSPVATPKAKPTAEPAPEQTTSDAEAAPAREEVTTDA